VKPVTLLSPSSALAVRAVERAGVMVYQYGFRPSLHVEYMSPSAVSVFGLQAEAFYADPYAPCANVHHEDRAAFEAMLTDTRGVPLQGRFRWRDVDGRFVQVEHCHVPVVEDDGVVSGFVGLALQVPDPRRPIAEAPWIGQVVVHVGAARIEDMRIEERHRLARELHDGLGQLLTGVKLDSMAIARMLRTLRASMDLVDRLQAITGQIDLAIAYVQRTAEGVEPLELDIEDGDLVSAIDYESRRMAAKSGLQILVSAREMEPLPPHVATAALRVFNEALTNVVRHARASTVRVTIGITRRGRFVLSVRDDGVGLAVRQSRRQPLGLLGMRERARAIGGSVRVSSAPGCGTNVLMLAPLRLD
jgi:signal transduction histidine kinase